MSAARNIWRLAYFSLGPALASQAHGADLPITVNCPTWQPEAASRVEARLRATLLAESLTAHHVGIQCGSDGSLGVSVESEHGASARVVERRSSSIEDDVVETVELVLRELIPTSAPPSPPPPSADPVATTAVRLQPAQAAPPPAATAAPTSSPTASTGVVRQRRIELAVVPVAERWTEHWAFGGTGALSVASERWLYGLALGGATAFGEPATFDVQEWKAGALVGFELREIAGLRATLAAGASLLVTAPAAEVVPVSGMLLSAAFLELHLSRPLWLGPLGVAPGAGARLFSGKRNVRVNAREQLLVPLLVPQVSLSLIHRQN